MREIVVCGEALVDVVATPPKPGAAMPDLAPAAGGGPFNVAITLGRLGGTVTFCSAVSTDVFGDAIMSALRGSGVGTTLVQRRDEPTTLAMAAIDKAGAASYSFYVEGTADRMVADPGPLSPTVSAVCFGTLSLVLEPGASVYETMMRRAHADGRLVVLDPNIRAAVIGDPDAYRRRFVSWLPHVDVIKVSDEDAAWLAAGVHGTSASEWLDSGVAAVVTTAGASGISVRTAKLQVNVGATAVDVVDTIGAGDSVLGGLVRALDIRGALSRSGALALGADEWHRVLEFAGRVAAVTVSRPGADPPWASELRTD